MTLPNAGGCDHSMEWHGLSSTCWQHASKVYIFGFRLRNCIAKDLPLEKHQWFNSSDVYQSIISNIKIFEIP